MVYTVWKLLVFPIYRLWLRKIEGLNNIPTNKLFIIAANHTSYYDSLLLHSTLIPRLNKKIHAFVNSLYWKYPIIRSILEHGECIPVFVEKEGNSKEKNKQASEKALNYLEKGEIIEIFPEGARSYDGKLRKAYNGVARLALKAKVPVLPVGIIDSYKVLPKGKIFPRLARCKVKIGKLMYFEKYYNKKLNNKIFEEVTRSIMKQIAKLISQKYNY